MSSAQLLVIYIAAFRKGFVWGLLVLFIPFVSLIFIAVYFGEMKSAVIMYVVGHSDRGGRRGTGEPGCPSRMVNQQRIDDAAQL